MDDTANDLVDLVDAFVGREARRGLTAAKPAPSQRRLVILQIDGLSSARLEHALARGEMPYLARRIASGGLRLRRLRAATPPSTPVFQAGLLYGHRAGVPGFAWFDRALGRVVRMDLADDVLAVERDLLRAGEPPLLDGGVSYGTIWPGGARDAFFNVLRWSRRDTIPRVSLRRDLHDLAASLATGAAISVKVAARLWLELAVGAWDLAQFFRRENTTKFEWRFLYMRLFVSVILRDIATHGAVLDVLRGVPVVYSDYVGYDEYAHRRGPYSKMALLKLWELDRALGRIIAAVNAVPELGYELYLFSDHGQAATRPAEQILGESLAEHLLGDEPNGSQTSVAVAQARRLRAMAKVLPGPLGTAALALARRAASALDAAQPASLRADGPLLVVPAGDIGHVYSTVEPEPLREPALRARHPGLLERCARCPAVGVALVRGEHGPLALRGDQRLELDRASDALALSHALGHPLAAVYARDLLSLRSAGDVVLLGTGAPGGQTVAFPWEFGSHGGLAPDQLETFMVHPASLGAEAFGHVVRPRDLHGFFWERSGRRVEERSASPASGA